MNTQSIETTLIAADYYINYYGGVIDIQNTTKILCLCTAGGGFGDGGADYIGWSNFDLFITNKKDFGKTLVKIGVSSESINGYDVKCSFTINGQKTDIDGFSATSFFQTIFKRD